MSVHDTNLRERHFFVKKLSEPLVHMELGKGRMEDDSLILEGICKRCGNKVVRLIEPEE